MAKRTTVVEESDEADRQRQAEELAELNVDEGGELFRVTDELRGTQGVNLMIVCLSPPEKEGYCGDMPIAEFSHARLKKLYGPGRYKIRVQGPKGFLPGGGLVKVAATPEPERGGGAVNDIAGLLELMDRRSAEKNEKFSKILELTIPGALTVLAAVIGRSQGPDMAALITALKPAPAPPPPSLAELATTLASMKTLSGEGQSKSDPADMLLKVMEAVARMSEGGGAQSNWMDVVRDLMKEVVPIGKSVLENRAQQIQQPPTPGAPLHIQPMAMGIAGPLSMPPMAASAPLIQGEAPPVTALGENDMMMLFNSIAKQSLEKIQNWARADKNPQTYAEVFLDDLPQMVATYITPDQAIEYLNREDWFEQVCGFMPSLRQYQEWLDEFRLELLELIQMQKDENQKNENKKEVPPQIIDNDPSENV